MEAVLWEYSRLEERSCRLKRVISRAETSTESDAGKSITC